MFAALINKPDQKLETPVALVRQPAPSRRKAHPTGQLSNSYDKAWRCGKCTYVNKGGHLSCDMCNTKIAGDSGWINAARGRGRKPGSLPGEASGAHENTQWSQETKNRAAKKRAATKARNKNKAAQGSARLSTFGIGGAGGGGPPGRKPPGSHEAKPPKGGKKKRKIQTIDISSDEDESMEALDEKNEEKSSEPPTPSRVPIGSGLPRGGGQAASPAQVIYKHGGKPGRYFPGRRPGIPSPIRRTGGTHAYYNPQAPPQNMFVPPLPGFGRPVPRMFAGGRGGRGRQGAVRGRVGRQPVHGGRGGGQGVAQRAYKQAQYRANLSLQGFNEAAEARASYIQQQAKKYSQIFGVGNQRSLMKSSGLKIVLVSPGHYRIRSDSVNEGVIAQIKNLLSRLKKRIAVQGTPVNKSKAFSVIMSLIRERRTVDINIL
jgi:hypothetical protein